MDLQKIKNLAHLARLELDDSKLEATEKDLTEILKWIDQISELDTENVEPLISVAQHTLPRRKDEVTSENLRDGILKNAPETDAEETFFAVPTVVE